MNFEIEEKALSLRGEASKWLFSIQTGVCTVMWKPMGEALENAPLVGLLLLLAWLGFALSALSSVLVMLALPQATEALGDGRYAPAKKRIQLLVGGQGLFFLAGAGCACLAALVKSLTGLLF